ncbi:MAG: SprT-like domain-containing protein [Gemmatimonadota bacterium]|nr:SprT-like domain-containing protein [Gemmatimonadota bacterium]
MSPRAADALQLGFGFAHAPDAYALLDPDPTPAEQAAGQAAAAEDAASRAGRLADRLRALGLAHIRTVRLTRNRSVLVSVKGFELRVHEAFVDAPAAMHEQIVRFVMARRKWERQAARDAIVGYPLPRVGPVRAAERTHPDDEPLVERLAEWHVRFNGERFGATLSTVPIRVSRRMKRRLGHFAPVEDGRPAEIAISARHLRRDGFAAAVETLLHEMVHQWQHESGRPLDHGPGFRRKCREVGALPRAKRAAG